jgi:hypothetical protein
MPSQRAFLGIVEKIVKSPELYVSNENSPGMRRDFTKNAVSLL